MNAQNESDSISYRVSESIKFRRANGLFVGSRLPYGYKYDVNESNINNRRKIVKEATEQNIILLILKLKYGCTYDIMSKLVYAISGHNVVGTYDDEKVILYGNYENSDIAHLLAANDIYNRGAAWKASNIYSICKNNASYFSKKDDYTKELISNLYNGQKLDTIKYLYEKINELPFDENQNASIIKNCKRNRNNIIIFLNKNNVFFNNWVTIDNIV